MFLSARLLAMETQVRTMTHLIFAKIAPLQLCIVKWKGQGGS